MKFVLIDETIVNRGFWAVVSGIDLTQFKKNPVMYWMHQRPNQWSGKNDQILPIGRWEKIKIETVNGNKAITAEAVFDEKDDFAMAIKSKVDGNFIRMASAGLEPFVWSNNKKDIKPGQTRSTLIKCQMKEASIVDIGANDNAVRLYDENGLIDLSDNNTNHIPILELKQHKNMKLIALKLGLNQDSSEAEILAKIEEILKLSRENSETLSDFKAKRVAKIMKHKNITDENKLVIQKLAEVNPELAEETLNLMSGDNDGNTDNTDNTERLSDHIKRKKLETDKEKKWTDYSNEELVDFRKNDRSHYIKLYKDEYGTVPTIEA